MRKLLLIALIALAAWQLWSRDPKIHAAASDVTLGYIVRYSGDADRGDRLPMLVALHGNGDTAANFHQTAFGELDVPSRIVLLKGPISYGTGQAWPWTPEEFALWGSAVGEVVGKLAEQYPTAGRPVLIGFSGGAAMAYWQAALHGDEYGAIFPISGRLTRDQLTGDPVPTETVVYAWHGRADEVLPIGGGRHAVRMLQESGTDARLTEFPGGHLGMFREMKPEISAALAVALEAQSKL